MTTLGWIIRVLERAIPARTDITHIDGTVTAHIDQQGPGWWNVHIIHTGWPDLFIGGFSDSDEALAEVERFIREDVPNRDRIMCERSWAL